MHKKMNVVSVFRKKPSVDTMLTVNVCFISCCVAVYKITFLLIKIGGLKTKLICKLA